MEANFHTFMIPIGASLHNPKTAPNFRDKLRCRMAFVDCRVSGTRPKVAGRPEASCITLCRISGVTVIMDEESMVLSRLLSRNRYGTRPASQRSSPLPSSLVINCDLLLQLKLTKTIFDISTTKAEAGR